MTELCKQCHQPLENHGTGCIPVQRDSNGPFKCPVCDGYKQIYSRPDGLIPIDIGGTFGPQFIDCPVCNGTGIVWK